MKFVDCGIVAGPNSTFLIEKLIIISEKLSNNKIKWYICKDNLHDKIAYNPEKKWKKWHNTNNFTNLQKMENVFFTEPLENKTASGGDRHGLGIDILIKHLKNKEKIIILEPDSFPCYLGWDDVLLSKIESNIVCATMNIRGHLNKKNFFYNNLHTPYMGDVGFFAVNPKILFNLKTTYSKTVYPEYAIDLKKYETMFKQNEIKNGNNTIIIDNNISKIFKLPEKTIMVKEVGWRIAIPLFKNNYDCFEFDAFLLNGEKVDDNYLQIFYQDEGKFLGFHLLFSRYFKEENFKSKLQYVIDFMSHSLDKEVIKLYDCIL